VSQVDTLHRAARALLQRPLLRAVEQEEFRLVRSQLADLRNWFDANTGWRLHADSDVIRLHKEPATTGDATRPARDPRNRHAFGRRRYVLVCLALAALERADAQIPLGRLAEQVLLLARGPAMADAGVEFTLTGRDQKTDLVAVVHLLLHWGVLARVAGDEEDYLRGTGDVLYDVSRRVLSQLLVARRGPSMVAAEAVEERIAALGAVQAPESDEATNRGIRHRLTRRLLDDPVLYYEELDEAEAEYLRRQRPAIVRRITELTGLVAEVRAEGIAMVDPEDDLTDVRLPEPGTDGHLTLLLAEHLARPGAREQRVEELRGISRDLAERHRTYWRKGATEPGAEFALTDAALERLAALRLIERRGDRVRALPALARFAVAEPVLAQPPAAPVAASLFEDGGDA
jgi:uncharacterized protein (TIGR02678 family)